LTYFSLGLALGIEVFVCLSLLEIPPFDKGGSEIVLALPFFALIIFALAMPGLLTGVSATRLPTPAGKFAVAGLVLNGVTLAIPILLLGIAVGRVIVSTVGPNESVNASLNAAAGSSEPLHLPLRLEQFDCVA